MKAHLFILFSILCVTFGFSQIQPKLENYPLESLEVNVVIFPFGLDHTIQIGTISKSGEIHFEFPKELPKISKEAEENFMYDVRYTIFNECDNSRGMVSENENDPSFQAGILSLSTNDNPYLGVIRAVSDDALMPWIEDPGYHEPVLGSYFELIYVATPFKYKGECIQTRSSDDRDMQIDYSFNLNLKAGFNFIEYRIESIHKTDPNEMASFPDKVSISSVEGIPNCKWIGKYF